MPIDVDVSQTNYLISVSAPTSTIDVALTGGESVSVSITSAPILVDVTDGNTVSVSVSNVGATGPAGPQGDPGQGVPAGGSAGQVLAKVDGTDYNTEWVTGGGGGGSGTVTSVSVTTANGVSGTVANATTTPAITLSLGAITPTSVTASGAVSGSNLTGTNTGDQTSIAGITGTKAQFDTACTDGNFLYVGDVTQYTDEMAQDAVGAMVDSTLSYNDATPSLGVNLNNANTWLADQSVPDEAYGSGWNGSTEVPTKNAIYDKIESMTSGGLSQAQVLARLSIGF